MGWEPRLSGTGRARADRLARACADLAAAPDALPGWPVAPGNVPLMRARCEGWLGLGLPERAVVVFAASPLPPLWVACAGALSDVRSLGEENEPWAVRWRSLLWVALLGLADDGVLPDPAKAGFWARSQKPWGLSVRSAPPLRAALLHQSLGGAESWRWADLVCGAGLGGEVDADMRRAFWGAMGWRAPGGWESASQMGRQLWPVLQDSACLAVGEQAGVRMLRERVLPAAAVAGGDPVTIRSVLRLQIEAHEAHGWWQVPAAAHRRALLLAAGLSPAEAAEEQWSQVDDDDLRVMAALRGRGGSCLPPAAL